MDAAPAGIRLWEVGNELYLPGNPGERKITQTPQAYAAQREALFFPARLRFRFFRP